MKSLVKLLIENIDNSIVSQVQGVVNLLSLITLYPGANHVPKDHANPAAGSVEVPSTRSAFIDAGLYFVLPPESPLLK